MTNAEPNGPDQDPAPEHGAKGVEIFTSERALDFVSERALDFVRDEAARRDWRHASLYAAADQGRVKDGVDVVQRLVAAHLELLRRQGRGARTGRRQHAQTVRAVLAETNEVSLVLAEAWLEAAYALLPRSRLRQDD